MELYQKKILKMSEKKLKSLCKAKDISERCLCNGLPPREESLGARRPFVFI